MLNITFDNPWVLLIAPAVIALALVASRATLAGQPLRRSRLVMRCLCVAALVLAAGAPQYIAETAAVSRIVAIDVSESVGELNRQKVEETVRAAISDLGENDEFGVVLFAGTPITVRSLQPVGTELATGAPVDLGIPPVALLPLDTRQTDVGAAIRHATSMMARASGARQALLVTDALDTCGDWRPAAATAGAQDVILYGAEPPAGVPRDVRISSLSAPTTVPENQAFTVAIAVASSCGCNTEVTLFKDGKQVGQRRLALMRGSESHAVFEFLPLDSPASRFAAAVGSGTGVPPVKNHGQNAHATAPEGFDDALGGNNSISFTVFRGEKPKVAVFGGREPAASAFEELVRSLDKYHVVHSTDVSGLGALVAPTGGGGAVIVIDGISADELGAENMKLLAGLCHDAGIGILALGGPKGLGMGGYSRSPLEKALPVLCDPGAEVAMAVLLDSSGSMDLPADPGEAGGGGSGTVKARRNKFTVAVDALAGALSLLAPNDGLSVIAFSGTVQQVFGPAPFVNAKVVRASLAKLWPTGSTLLLPPLKKALADLIKLEGKKKHLIVISDGETQEPDAELAALAAAARSASVSVTTLGIGEKHNEKLLRLLTSDGENGRYVKVGAVTELERALREVVSREKELFREERAAVVPVADAALFAGLSSAPAVGGFNVARAKDDAVVHAVLGSGRQPLVAAWQYGLGRSAAFMSSFDTTWLDGWKDWKDLGSFFARLLDSLMPREDSRSPLRVFGELREGRAVVVADATNLDAPGKNKYALKLEAVVYTTQGKAGPFQMAQSEPGVYEVVVPINESGNFAVTVAEKEVEGATSTRIPPAMGSLFVPFALELQRVGCDDGKLSDLASATGGQVVGLKALRIPRRDMKASQPFSLTPFAVILALVLFFSELLLARVRR